jgi:hypothetical protein
MFFFFFSTHLVNVQKCTIDVLSLSSVTLPEANHPNPGNVKKKKKKKKKKFTRKLQFLNKNNYTFRIMSVLKIIWNLFFVVFLLLLPMRCVAC